MIVIFLKQSFQKYCLWNVGKCLRSYFRNWRLFLQLQFIFTQIISIQYSLPFDHYLDFLFQISIFHISSRNSYYWYSFFLKFCILFFLWFCVIVITLIFVSLYPQPYIASMFSLPHSYRNLVYVSKSLLLIISELRF